MDKENVKMLYDNLYWLGFDPSLSTDAEKKMRAGIKQFTLETQTPVESMGLSKKAHYLLEFIKPEPKKDIPADEQKERWWYLNNYTTTLSEKGKVEAQQKFIVYNGNGLTARESVNMLEKRGVFKKRRTIDKTREFEAWSQIDFTKKDNWGNLMINTIFKYDLSRALHQHPIKELQNPEQKEKLMRSLRKGHLAEVSFVINKEEVKRYVGANPRDQNVVVYDQNFVKLTKEIERSQYQRPDRTEGLVFTKPGTNDQETLDGSTRNTKQGSSIKQDTAVIEEGSKSKRSTRRV